MTEVAKAGALKPKEKTKAKKRYLKKKRERRKTRKPTKANDRDQTSQDEGEDNEEVEDDDEDIQMDAPREETPKSLKPPKKRRKVEAPEESTMDVDEEQVPITSSAPDPVSVPTPGTLPLFPLPALPNLPSRQDLALQGLDQALVDAEFIDPSTSLPIPLGGENDGGTSLSERSRKRLHELGVAHLFAVQTSLLPFLLPKEARKRALYCPHSPPRDVCVSAPTGSGKTLAYVLPIVETLSSRIVIRLRALVVLPTRDLVNQVKETFEAVAKGCGLRIGTATGQHSFSHEQSQLIADRTSNLQGGSSKVDVLICTPGRLIDHMNDTPNFTLQHLRYLVIDEADRLLAQSFQDWLAQVLLATRPSKSVRGYLPDTPDFDTPVPVPCHNAIAPAFHPFHSSILDGPNYVYEPKETSCQKLLFSATLTRDPSKIAVLELRDPKYFIVHSSRSGKDASSGLLDMVMEQFTMPESLTEHMIVCESSQKPLHFFYLVHAHSVLNCLVFTKSAESTTRLVRLFEYFEQSRANDHDSSYKPIVIHPYSSDLGAADRRSVLEKFKAQEIQILVCSDLISRGIDIQHVSHVVSYDAPVDIRKYVHRVGRTARAGRHGDAWTLVEEQEARYFKTMLKDADHLDKVKRLRVSDKNLSPLLPHYEKALGLLKEAYSR
ncbi:DEAD-domain-containing protein [Desarmillaria tabescens]|uniref:ATP-dependent RNA helicase n=1 Tax=Armillaria tabescens TaxID=1929756 RepID=A0AA39TY78_ARMTA|nr:DEAD-domain-containing protein [Desarmillaria tabescens]KAK0469813.1 DEAD-domain-containing protein [Desarmillaria tabescens]